MSIIVIPTVCTQCQPIKSYVRMYAYQIRLLSISVLLKLTPDGTSMTVCCL